MTLEKKLVLLLILMMLLGYVIEEKLHSNLKSKPLEQPALLIKISKPSSPTQPEAPAIPTNHTQISQSKSECPVPLPNSTMDPNQEIQVALAGTLPEKKTEVKPIAANPEITVAKIPSLPQPQADPKITAATTSLPQTSPEAENPKPKEVTGAKASEVEVLDYCEYAVQQKDSLWGIVRIFYNIKEEAEVNGLVLQIIRRNPQLVNPNHLPVGLVLQLPQKPTRYDPQSISSTIKKANPKLPARHLVQNGDTLYKLALEYYNDCKAFTRILDANSDIVKDPNYLPSGIYVTIPQ